MTHRTSRLKTVFRWLLGVLMIAAGINHFANPAFYTRIMPPFLPWHLPLVYVSGVVESALGALLLWPRTARLAAWGLIATYLAVFPANIYAALVSGTDHPAMPGVSPLAAWVRLPFQAVFIAWAYWFTRPSSGPAAQPTGASR
jgi:uncharacterized membrane protein